MVEALSIFQRRMEPNLVVPKLKFQLMILLVQLVKQFIPLVKELVALTRIQAVKLRVDQSITFINKMLISKLFITYKTQILPHLSVTRSKCIKS